LPSSFEDGDFKRWLLHFEVCAEANGWSDTIKAKKLPTFLKGEAPVDAFRCSGSICPLDQPVALWMIWGRAGLFNAKVVQ
ncbi:hypothetical protein T05_16362, partial [Trichinella murrelli]